STPIVRWLVLAALATAMLPSGRSWYNVQHQANRLPLVETERGVVRVAKASGGRDLEEILSAVKGTPLPAGFFFYPYDPMLPYLTMRRQVASLDIFVPAYTSTDQYMEACNETMKSARWVLLDRLWADPEYLKRIFPALDDPSPREKVTLEAAVFEMFSPSRSTPRYVLLRRNPLSEGSPTSGDPGRASTLVPSRPRDGTVHRP